MVNYERVRREIPHFSYTGDEKGPAISANNSIILVNNIGIEQQPTE